MTDPEAVRLHQVAQRAANLERALAFYRDVLSLRFIARFDPPGLVFFELGNVRLLLEQGASPALLYLEVDDVEATCTRLRSAGVEVVAEPHMIHRDDAGQFGPVGTEEWMAFIRDSEDNVVGFVERRPPPGSAEGA